MNTPTSSQDSTPLGADDFDALDNELDALRETEELTPDWEFCEGFLAALVCTRREISPDEYWPALLGEQFNPMDHMEFVWRWKRRWAEIQAALDAPVESLEDERAYQPETLDVRGAILALPEDQRGDVDFDELPSFGEAWANGFLHAVQSWPEDWMPPRDKEAAGILEDALEAVQTLAAPDTGKPSVSMHTEDGPPSVSDQRLNDFGEALWAIYDLRQLWKSLGPRIESVRKVQEPGRNDLCPCGSGKKYKKCHGA